MNNNDLQNIAKNNGLQNITKNNEEEKRRKARERVYKFNEKRRLRLAVENPSDEIIKEMEQLRMQQRKGQKTYYQKNKEKIIEQAKNKYHRKLEEIGKEQKRTWYTAQTNKEKFDYAIKLLELVSVEKCDIENLKTKYESFVK